MASCADFLTKAIKGMEYAKSKTMTFGSSNKFGNMLANLAFPALALGAAREQQDAIWKAEGIPSPISLQADWPRHGFEYIQTMALTATSMGVGNCGELASLAFMYFYDKDIFPVDYMIIGKGEHAFCVIGAPVMPTFGNFPEWSTGTATVCDPWEWRAEPACHLIRRYPQKIKKMRSYCRFEA